MKFEGFTIYECNTFIKKLKGLMFKKNINYGLMFKKCNSIHTFFMKQNIDVIFLDKNNNIIKRYNNITKNKILICKDAFQVIEIPHKK